MICCLLTNDLTDSNMKRMTKILAAVTLWSTAIFGLSSCIYDAPGDRFFRTLWECTEAPLDTFESNRLTLEFLCGNAISIKTDTPPRTAFGTYESSGEKAVFEGLVIEFDGHMITFTDAIRSGDILYLRWTTENSAYPFTTTMHRLSSYN